MDAVHAVGWVDVFPESVAEACRLGLASREHCFGTLGEALERDAFDAVLVTTDLPAHVPVVREALQAGKHVIVEKPFAPTIAEATELARLAEDRRLILMVSQNYRFFPAVQAVHRIVREGALGRPLHVDLDFRKFSSPLTTPLGHREWAQPLLMDMAIHHFDLLRYVLGSEPATVRCNTWNPTWAGYKDPPEGSAWIEFDNDVSVSYRGSWINPSRPTLWAGDWRMEFEDGELWWTSRGNNSTESEDSVAAYDHHGEMTQLSLPQLRYIDRAGSLAAFVAAVDAGTPPESSASDNINSLALMLAAIESSQRGGPVDIAAIS